MTIIDVNTLLRPQSVLAKSIVEKLLRGVKRTRERGWGVGYCHMPHVKQQSLQDDSICSEDLWCDSR